jgi:hypothetical protein
MEQKRGYLRLMLIVAKSRWLGSPQSKEAAFFLEIKVVAGSSGYRGGRFGSR